MGLFSYNEEVRAINTHFDDQQHAAQVKAVRDNAKNIGLSKRETERRVERVNRRFGR